jgi:hypothetical protein
MSREKSHLNIRSAIAWITLATLAMLRTQPAEPQEKKPLPKPGETYVGIAVNGCADRCPSYEIYFFENGRMKYRPNNKFTTERDSASRTPFGNEFKSLAEFISSKDLFKEKSACTADAGHTSVTLHSTVGGEARKAYFSLGCPADVETATTLITRFVNSSGTWRLINNKWEYWTAANYDAK